MVSPVFAVMLMAVKGLVAVGELLRHRLEEAGMSWSVETGRRLDQVLNSIQEPTPERLRQTRACEVLEGIGTPAARELLRRWAAGPGGARLTAEATASLARR
jgi:hypothetical protein